MLTLFFISNYQQILSNTHNHPISYYHFYKHHSIQSPDILLSLPYTSEYSFELGKPFKEVGALILMKWDRIKIKLLYIPRENSKFSYLQQPERQNYVCYVI